MLKRYFPWPFHLAIPVPCGICRASYMHILSLWLYSKLLHNSHVSLTHITQGCFVSVKAIAWFQFVDIRNDQIMRLVTEALNCQFGYISIFLMIFGNMWLTIIVLNPTHSPVNLTCDATNWHQSNYSAVWKTCGLVSVPHGTRLLSLAQFHSMVANSVASHSVQSGQVVADSIQKTKRIRCSRIPLGLVSINSWGRSWPLGEGVTYSMSALVTKKQQLANLLVENGLSWCWEFVWKYT